MLAHGPELAFLSLAWERVRLFLTFHSCFWDSFCDWEIHLSEDANVSFLIIPGIV